VKAQALRRLLNEEPFVYMPSAYDALGGRLVEDLEAHASIQSCETDRRWRSTDARWYAR
jgi:hypothetical protein